MLQLSSPSVPHVRSGTVVLQVTLCAAGFLAATPMVHAQTTPPLWVEGRVSTGLTLSSNGAITPVPQSEQAIEVSPGVRIVANGARVKGSLDYAVRAMHDFQDTAGDNLRHSLNTQGRVEVWDGRAFIDVSGVVSDEAISAFGPVGGSGISDTNHSQTASFRFSPYLQGGLAGWADYQLRYTYATSNIEQASRSDSRSRELALSLQDTGLQTLGWSLQAQTGRVDYSLGRETRSDSLRLGFNYRPSPQLLLTALAGVERNDVLTVSLESYNLTGIGFDWRPSPLARLALDLQKRYFGHSHNLQLEYRSGRTLWRVRDVRDASNSPEQLATASLGSLYDLLDAFYLTTIPDPVLRAQQVQAELLQLGLPADTVVFQNFLSSSATLARTQSLSAVLQGRRTVLTATLSSSRTSRLQSIISLGDDFDNSSYVLQQGLSLAVAHRLTPLSALSVEWGLQRSEGSLASLKTRTHSLAVHLSTQLAPRTSGSLLLRRTVQNSPTSPYGETAIAGMVNHRF